MVTKRAQANDGYGSRWDPGFPIPDGTVRLTINATTVVQGVVETKTWYWVYVPSADDVYIQFGTSAVSAIDRTKNARIPPAIYNPMFSLDCTHVAIVADATASGYVYLIKIAGDDALG